MGPGERLPVRLERNAVRFTAAQVEAIQRQLEEHSLKDEHESLDARVATADPLFYPHPSSFLPSPRARQPIAKLLVREVV